MLNTTQYRFATTQRLSDGVPGLKIKMAPNGSVSIENVYQFECHN